MLNSPTGATRRRVILADDSLPILQSAASILKNNFDIVDCVSNGELAVKSVLEHKPDVVVLDVAMPVLDGISAAVELGRMGVTSKIVFLSMHGEEDYITAALAAGARGYVIKARMASDLPRAVDYALQGRMFVSRTKLEKTPVPPDQTGVPAWWKYGSSPHALEFYRDNATLVAKVAEIAKGVLEVGDGVILVATQEHRIGICRTLESHGVNVAAATKANRYVSLDTSETLATYSDDGNLNLPPLVSVFRSTVHAALAAASRVFAFCEMGPILYTQERADDGRRLEQAWVDAVIADHSFMLCGYPFSSQENRDGLRRVCQVHG